MTINEFLEEYNKANESQKKVMIKDHITHYYCPIAEKIAFLEYGCTMSKKEKNGIEYIDMIINRLWFTLSIIRLYTDIEFDTEGKNLLILKDYDLVAQTDMIALLSEYIGEDELNELLTVNKGILDNFNIVANSFNTAFSTVLDKISNFIQTNSKPVLEILNNNNLVDFIKKE